MAGNRKLVFDNKKMRDTQETVRKKADAATGLPGQDADVT
jgi:hypothetical protein